MKSINLLSLIQAKNKLDKVSYKSFLKYYGISIKDKEVNDIKSLIKLLNIKNASMDLKKIYNQFYVSYTIPQIGKEFDLLRFGKKCIINIEIKSSATEDKILKQLQRNKYYLEHIDKDIYYFGFVSETKQLYILVNDELKQIKPKKIAKLLYEQKNEYIENIDTLFDPSDYLVSPFNSTDRFINDEYFLTNQQEDVKNKILSLINDTSKPNFIALTGSAGMGKTLLTYDIAKSILDDNKKVLIIHCGNLNDGQVKLRTEYNWNIIGIKAYGSYKIDNYDLIIIDEAQRIYPTQLDEIAGIIEASNGNCIFSYDKAQTLATWEEKRNVVQTIQDIDSIETFKLSDKIRTNKEIASFIKMLFNRRKNIPLTNSSNIEINYFDNAEDSKDYLGALSEENWEVIRFTPSQYNNEIHEKYAIHSETSHRVIGQEFDNVTVIIDPCFFYNEEDTLQYRCKSYYHPVKMLFQNLTRARKRINLVVINNNEVLNRCLDILKTEE